MREAHAALARWRDWGPLFAEAPNLVRELCGGLTNRNFLIKTGDRQFVLRLASPHDELFGIDRVREQLILQDAAAAGIAPTVHYSDVAHGILVTAYLDGTPLAPGLTSSRTDDLVELVNRIHALPTSIAVDDYYAHAERYRRQLERARLELPAPVAALGDRIRDERARGIEKPDTIRICHRDLNPANVIDCAGRLYVIDWEYATRGASAFDFAALTTEWRLPREQMSRAAGIERGVLEHAIRLYRYTCALWHLLSANAGNS